MTPSECNSEPRRGADLQSARTLAEVREHNPCVNSVLSVVKNPRSEAHDAPCLRAPPTRGGAVRNA
jgi:hypothetical protein